MIFNGKYPAPTSPPPPRGGGHLSTSGDDVDRHKWEIQWVETRDATKHLTWHKVTGPTTKNDLVLSILWVPIMSVAKPVFHIISSCLAPLQIFLHDGAAGLHGSLLFTLFLFVCVFPCHRVFGIAMTTGGGGVILPLFTSLSQTEEFEHAAAFGS